MVQVYEISIKQSYKSFYLYGSGLSGLGHELGETYAVKAIGDEERIQDIDLEVIEINGKRMGKDDDSSNTAIVNFKAPRNGLYKIKVSANEMSNLDGFYGIVVARTKSPADQLLSLLGSAIDEAKKDQKVVPGVKVLPGPDWRWGTQGRGTVGVIQEVPDSDGWVPVKWANGEKNNYRWGADGKYDLRVVSYTD
jgi:hypothetical protein